MAPPLLSLQDIALSFGGHPLLDGVELSVAPGERLCVVGRNGSGKSTLLKIAAGQIEPDRGSRFVQPGATLRYLPQEPDFTGFSTTLGYVEAGLGPGDQPYRARYLLEQLGLTGDEDPAQLSGGEARRTALARALAPQPDILLLDEPTNHLDVAVIEWLERELSSLKSALVIISHDRRFLQNLTRSVVWIDRGKARRLEMGFGPFETWRDEMLAQEEVDRQKLDRKIVAEEHWVRYGVTARRKRNVRRMAQLQSLRDTRRTERRSAGQTKLTVADGALSGKLVAETKGASKSYDGRAIVRDFTFRIHRGDRVGVVGPNGAGKTTLISLLTGALEPDTGEVRLGANLQMAALEQGRDSLNPNWTLAEALTGGRSDTVTIGGQTKHVVAYMADFLFPPEQARTPIRVLSGGERARLMLARSLAKPSNFLVLDEPTNDLDIETLDVLEEMLGDFPGTVILISHDRDFLDRIVGSVLAPEGDGRWLEYAGGYTDMIAQRGADLAGKAVVERGAAKEAKLPARSPRERAADGESGGGGNGKNGGARRRLSFNDQHALKTLPATMATLEKKIAATQKVLADPGLFSRDRAKFDKTSAELSATQTELAEAEERWLTLEMLREELGG
jgi:ATP-binding cassette subfamily F protein uup